MFYTEGVETERNRKERAIDAATLAQAMGNALSTQRYEQLTEPFNRAMRQADITNVNRAAMWCAQLGHESVGLQYLEEIADGSAYEGRTDLGNTQPGDGTRFKGRGAIQVTGRTNYTQVSQWAHERGIVDTPTYFVDNPEALGSEEHAFTGAVWYWTVARPQLNTLSDNQDLVGATEAINGGSNGLEDRRQRYQRCLALGDALLPNDAEPQPQPPKPTPTPKPEPKEELTMADVNTINKKLDLILDQLAGPEKNRDGYPRYTGWRQLGGKTLVDAVADIRNRVLR